MTKKWIWKCRKKSTETEAKNKKYRGKLFYGEKWQEKKIELHKKGRTEERKQSERGGGGEL